MGDRLSSTQRVLKIDLQDHPVAFLWGPRQVGKTTLLKQQFPQAKFYDLLDSDLRTELTLRPKILREELEDQKPKLVVMDEIQKVPALLDEIHWLVENTPIQFILCGSSPRKLKHEGANLLGGRAWRFQLFPLTTREVSINNLEHVFNHGLMPSHYFSKKPERSLKSYVYDYLQEEIHREAQIRNIPAFHKFLQTVALTHGQLLNYSNVASEAGVAHNTARDYFQILQDTLLGHTLPPWKKTKERRLIATEKFYLFDLGLVRALLGMPLIQNKTTEFGRFFEHFLIEEIRAYLSYQESDQPMTFWRTSTGYEVDLIVGSMEMAIEFKARETIASKDTRSLTALMEEHRVKHPIIVSLDPRPRKLENGITILHWKDFCHRLWEE
ncbi:MAG: ATP-binding protein [Chlamydiae bacterium]|nr:ATP-binding protein [Chlamydiota bacterium]